MPLASYPGSARAPWASLTTGGHEQRVAPGCYLERKMVVSVAIVDVEAIANDIEKRNRRQADHCHAVIVSHVEGDLISSRRKARIECCMGKERIAPSAALTEQARRRLAGVDRNAQAGSDHGTGHGEAVNRGAWRQ